MFWDQVEFQLKNRPRGIHLVTAEVQSQLPSMGSIEMGLLHLFIKHTSASLAINENADPTVRHDVEQHLNVMVPENAPYFRHTYEGPDDMPAHIKSIITGSELTIPIISLLKMAAACLALGKGFICVSIETIILPAGGL